MTYVEKQVLLQSLDHLWREHLVTLDHLRQVIGWRGYAQRDPLNEYKSEAFELFNGLVGHLREQVTGQLMRIEVVFQQPEPERLPPMFAQHLDPLTGENELAHAAGRAFGAGPALGFAAPQAARRSRRATRTTRRPGAGSAATSPAPAARARSTSTATAGSWREARKPRRERAVRRHRRASGRSPHCRNALAGLSSGGVA